LFGTILWGFEVGFSWAESKEWNGPEQACNCHDRNVSGEAWLGVGGGGGRVRMAYALLKFIRG